MIRFCREDDAEEYIIGTEMGMIHRLSVDVPGKRYYLASEATICPTMKLTTLRKAIEALRAEAPVVTVPEDIRAKALVAVRRMVEIGG